MRERSRQGPAFGQVFFHLRHPPGHYQKRAKKRRHTVGSETRRAPESPCPCGFSHPPLPLTAGATRHTPQAGIPPPLPEFRPFPSRKRYAALRESPLSQLHSPKTAYTIRLQATSARRGTALPLYGKDKFCLPNKYAVPARQTAQAAPCKSAVRGRPKETGEPFLQRKAATSERGTASSIRSPRSILVGPTQAKHSSAPGDSRLPPFGPTEGPDPSRSPRAQSPKHTDKADAAKSADETARPKRLQTRHTPQNGDKSRSPHFAGSGIDTYTSPIRYRRLFTVSSMMRSGPSGSESVRSSTPVASCRNTTGVRPSNATAPVTFIPSRGR